ncbi:MAG: OsmC family peroxiredoxin, partial [Promethearchaeota archaeon]
MVREESAKIELKLEKDMIFKGLLDLKKIHELFVDESLESEEEQIGPDAAQLIGLGVMSCLSASLIFCLEKRNLKLDDLTAETEVHFKTIKKNLTRIEKIDVKLSPKSDDPDVIKRLNQCTRVLKNDEMFFET